MPSRSAEAELQVTQNIERIFSNSPDSIGVKLENFTKYVRRRHLKRFLTLYEIFKQVLPVKGSVIDCGVFKCWTEQATTGRGSGSATRRTAGAPGAMVPQRMYSVASRETARQKARLRK
jgi:hypothetical protein